MGTALLLSGVMLFTNPPARGNQSKENTEKKSVLSGRVLAYVDSMVVGAGLGPQYEKFIFASESKGGQGEPIVTPVEIVYAFHKSDGLLPHSFFDYAKLYALRVVRDQNCDEKVSVLSYEKNEDSNGKQLPPTYILRVMDGASKDLLKPDSILPCYMLRPGNYQELK